MLKVASVGPGVLRHFLRVGVNEPDIGNPHRRVSRHLLVAIIFQRCIRNFDQQQHVLRARQCVLIVIVLKPQDDQIRLRFREIAQDHRILYADNGAPQ